MAAGSLWEALAGRAPGRPVGPAEPDLYDAVIERLNPARARPRLRDGIEEARLVSVRGAPYVMLRSPGEPPAYLRLDPSEVELARLMDGARSVASLVGEFARITGRLAPPQVIRVVADLAANRMLEELPVDAFHAVRSIGGRSTGERLRRTVGDILRGRQFATVQVDGLATFLYRAGGRLLFTRVGGAVAALVAVIGAAVFASRWVEGEQAVFVVADSHALGALALLGLNVVCVAAHELGHALAAKHAGRRVPTGGVMLYFGIPSVYVDTSDVWMAGRRARLLTAASGPLAAVVLAGAVNLAAVVAPELAPAAFKLGFLWYLNVVFNLNPLLALDGYHMLMDWLELPNLRARGLALTIARLRQRRFGWNGLTGENRLYAMYGTAAVFWLVVTLGLGIRMWKDRIDGLGASLWHEGIGGQAGVALIVGLLLAPLIGSALGRLGDAVRSGWSERRARDPAIDLRRRLEVLRQSVLLTLEPMVLADIAGRSSWVRPRSGGLLPRIAAPTVVAAGILEGASHDDAPGVVRRRALRGDIVAGGPGPDEDDGIDAWRAYDARLLVLPPDVVVPGGSIPGREAAPFAAGKRRGPHGDSSPVLVWPAGATPPADDGTTDRRLGRRFLWLLLLLGGLAVLSMLIAVPPGPTWSELGDHQVLATVEQGTATIHRRSSSVDVRAGDRIAVGAGETIDVGSGSRVDLLFRGGSTGRLCSGSNLRILALSTVPGDPDQPTAGLTVPKGALALSITAPTSALASLRVEVPSHTTSPVGWSGTGEGFVVTADGVAGTVDLDGQGWPDTWCAAGTGGLARVLAPTPIAATSSPLPSPGAIAPADRPSQGSAEPPSPSVAALDSPSATPASPDSTDQPVESAGPTPTASSATVTPTRPPTATASPRPTATRSPTPTATPSPRLTPKPSPKPSPTPAPIDDFSIGCSPGVLQATPGQSVVTICTITSLGSFSSPVFVACTNIDGLATCTYVPPNVAPSAGGTVLVEVIIRAETAVRPGCHDVSIAATSGSLSRRASVLLDIASDAGSSCQGGTIR